MSTSGRKGNWNNMAGTPKKVVVSPQAKESKKLKEEELTEHPLEKSKTIKSELYQPITKA